MLYHSFSSLFVENIPKKLYNTFGDNMFELKSSYVSVNYDRAESYGGNQRRSADPVIKKCGCGIVAALDTLLYLCYSRRWSCVLEPGEITESGPIPHELYEESLAALKKNYFPVMYPLGTNGFALALGMNRFFKKHCLPFHASWYAAGRRLWERMGAMLSHDIPVIVAVGQNFPRFWERKGVSLQIMDSNGSPKPGASARAHFVTVTGLDTDWMQLSSWGVKYVAKRSDFMRYALKNSSPLLCGMLYIEKK